MKKAKDIEGNLVLKEEKGPFHIIGDVHGCFEELLLLLHNLGYAVQFNPAHEKYEVLANPGYKIVFVGDLVDRGPNSPEVLRLVMDLVEQEVAWCVSGNHDDKLKRKLQGNSVHIRHGLELTLAQLASYRAAFTARVGQFLSELPHHIVLDEGKLVVAHAGLAETYHGRHSKWVRQLCLFGPTNGELDHLGLPIRLDWATDYSGTALVVYGHTPVKEPRWKNNTINIDTGCVFGGKLTAISYPALELTSVRAIQPYADSMRPFLDPKPENSTQ
ncbi:protein phosphatase [Pontibacter qinzhouensis]|uniref:Protein phosphatase n=1 Tax=Pontibacter qinzhouensis TaxID=2603253 RepID=A0A5C8KCG0_9BACT|nr:metallophosphoesterase [Pontibacter qinzhouensis]TXK51929.1 protein phosphatase [Pontibacter qinzhouensis]